MAKLFLTNINLNGNQLVNGVVHRNASAPSSPTPIGGQLYFNTTDSNLYAHNGTAFTEVLLSGTVVNADIAAGAAIAVSKLAASTISGISLGSNLAILTFGTGLTAGGASYNGSTAVTITPVTASTSVAGIVQLESSTSSTSTTTAATPASVKSAYDLANAALPKSGGTMTGAISLGSTTGSDGFNITGLKNPANPYDAVNKSYVDATKSGLDVKDSVRAATTANITLSSTQTIDDVAVIAGDRVLVKNQTTTTENGIWVVAAGAWSRSSDADTGAKLTSGSFTFVEEGTANQDSGWVMTTNGTITIGTSPIAWSQFSGAGQITAGAGLTKNGNTLDVGTASSSRIVVNTDNIDLATVTQTNTTPTIGTTVITGVTVDSYGRVSGLATSTNKFTGQNTLLTVTAGVATWTITHNLGTKDVIVQFRQVSNDEIVEADIVNTSTSVTTITIASTAASIAADTYRVVILA